MPLLAPHFARAVPVTQLSAAMRLCWLFWGKNEMPPGSLSQGNGAVAAGISVDGIIVRDLQLPEQARHAYVLRPLPARARRLNSWLNLLRRQLLGIVKVSRAKFRWASKVGGASR